MITRQIIGRKKPTMNHRCMLRPFLDATAPAHVPEIIISNSTPNMMYVQPLDHLTSGSRASTSINTPAIIFTPRALLKID
jgi:hypothetical protein